MSAKTETAKPNGRPAPHECPTRHRPGMLCPTCGGTPPIGRALSDTPDEPYELRWSTWYRTYSASPDPATVTPPEQRAAIEAATRRYQEACAAHDAAIRAFIEAVRTGRGTRLWTLDGSRQAGEPELIARARGQADEQLLAIEAAEKGMAAALRELNEVSLPARERARQRGALAAARRLARWVMG